MTTGCSTQPRLTSHTPKVNKLIPIIPPLRWIGDITAIALEWTPNYDPAIAGYHVYRKLKNDKKAEFDLVARINDRFTSHYIDLHLPFETKYLYYVTAYNRDGFESLPSKYASTITRPTLKSVVYFDSVNKLPRKAKLIWRPHTNGRVSAYILERKTPAEKEWKELATLEHRLSAEYIDRELEDNQVYLYRLRAVTFDEIQSTPSDIVKIITKALPKPIEGVTASTNLPKTIVVSWKPHKQKDVLKDIKEYRIYRGESADGSFDLYKTSQTTTFIDNIEGHGKSFNYKITAVDFDGLESLSQQNVQGQNLPRPQKVSLHTATIKEDKVTLGWEKSDERTVSYKVIKKEKLGWFKSNDTPTTTTETNFNTTQEPNISVTYEIYAIDIHGIESEPVTTEALIFEKVVP